MLLSCTLCYGFIFPEFSPFHGQIGSAVGLFLLKWSIVVIASGINAKQHGL